MKKLLCGILISILFVLSGCEIGKSDRSICFEKMQELIAILDTNDKEALNRLFAENSIKKIDDFPSQAADLFEYYQGTSYKISENNGLIVTDKFDNGKATKVFDISYIINTDISEYSIAVKWCIEDDFDKSNVGIQCIYILNNENNPYPEYKYWGDGTGTEGIFTNRLYGGFYTDLFMERVAKNNKNSFREMFREDIAKAVEFEDKMNVLFDTYECEYDIVNSFVRTYSDDNETGYEISSYYVKGFESAEVSYKMCMRWCYQNTFDRQGIVSVYITKINGQIDMEEPYWGDGLWTEGINII